MTGHRTLPSPLPDTEPMSDVMQFDHEMSRRIETTYTTADVMQQRRIVREALALKPGEHVLDIGSGPGFGSGWTSLGPTG